MKLTSLNKFYGEKAALKGVDLTIEEGKITAVLGESGAGKTTLLSVIAGLVPFEGSVEGAGRVSYLFQSPLLLPHLTVEGNLRFVLPKEKWGEIPAMLARVGLKGKETSRPACLSGGEKQRVAIARAFLYPHETLLMDEPFSSLDLSLKRSLIELTCELWRESGGTVVFVTHDVREAACLSHRAIVLREGEVGLDIPISGDPPREFFRAVPEEEILTRALLRLPQSGDSPT